MKVRWLCFTFHVQCKQESEILAQLNAIYAQGVVMAGELARLQTEVAEIGGVVDSAIALIDGLAQQIRDLVAAGDPAALTALADDLDQRAALLAAAVAANTPA